MSSKDITQVSSHRPDTNGFNPQLLFPDNDALRFNCGRSDHGPKTRELTGFIDDKMCGGSVQVDRREQMYFQSLKQQQMSDYRRSVCAGNAQQSGTDESEEEDDTDELDDDEDLFDKDCNNNNNNNNNSSDSVHSIGPDKIGVNVTVSRHHSSFGSSMDAITNDGNIVQSLNNTRECPGGNLQQVRATLYQNPNGESDGDTYYPQYVHETNGTRQGKGERVLEDGRKVASFSNESGNSLKEILSDPISGVLMEDAVILPCGHSFGGGGIQHVLKMKACYSCSHPISEESVQPNLSLRSAVTAFRREEKVRSLHSIKRREKFEDKGTYGDSSVVENSRGRGVQFPFVVTDRVVIKGNKRTPERFVGREAIVTTQCLNGWYVVKTLDNAESVKLQYRSLAKMADNSSSQLMSSKGTPNLALDSSY